MGNVGGGGLQCFKIKIKFRWQERLDCSNFTHDIHVKSFYDKNQVMEADMEAFLANLETQQKKYLILFI